MNERLEKNYVKYVSKPICQKLIRVIDPVPEESPEKNKENSSNPNIESMKRIASFAGMLGPYYPPL